MSRKTWGIAMLKNMIMVILMGSLVLGPAGAVWMNYAPGAGEVVLQFSKPVYTINTTGQSMQGYYPLIGQSFWFEAIPLAGQTAATSKNATPVVLGSIPVTHYTTDFGQNWERNMEFAQTRSSFKIAADNTLGSIGQNWNIFDTRWIVI